MTAMVTLLAIISSFEKLWASKSSTFGENKGSVLGIEIAINMTAVIRFVIPLIIFNIGSPQFMLVANKLVLLVNIRIILLW